MVRYRYLAVVLAGLSAATTGTADGPSGVIARLGSDRFRHADAVRALTYSPDGKHLAAGCDGSILIWDAADGRRIRSIEVEGHQVFALRYSADGRNLYAATTAADVTHLLRIDPTTGRMRSKSTLRKGKGRGVFSADGTFLAIWTLQEALYRILEGKVIHVVNLATGNDWTERLQDESIESLAFRSDSKALVVGSNRGRVRVYDPRNGKLLNECAFDEHGVGDIAFFPEGLDVVAVSKSPDAKRLARLDAETGTVRWEFKTKQARKITISPDGRSVIYRGVDAEDKHPDHWHWLDAVTGKPTGVVLDVGNPHLGASDTAFIEVLEYPVAWHPDGRTIAVSGHSGLIAQWDLKDRKRLLASADPPSPVTELYLTPNGSKVRGWARGWYEWDLTTGKQTRLTPDLGHAPSDRLAISRDLKWLARALPVDPAAVEIIDVATRARKHILKDVPEGVSPYFLKDGRLVIAFSDALHLYDPESGRRLVRIAFPLGDEHRLHIAADGRSASRLYRNEKEIRITSWSLSTGKVIHEWSGEVAGFGERRDVGSGTWLSPDGKIAAFHSTWLVAPNVTEGQTVLLECATGRKLGDWIGGWFDGLTFTPDGRSVLTYHHRPFSYYLREVATGGYRAQVRFDLRPATSFTFGPAGRTMIVATRPKPVEVWDAIGDAGPWEAAKADRHWQALASSDAEAAYVSMRNLLAHPSEAAVFLKSRVKVPEPLAADWVAERLKGLDAPAFRDREKVTSDLAAVGELAVAPLQAALPTASAEAKSRIQKLLANLEWQTPEKLRAVRVCEVAEGLGSAAATELLEAWAKGDSGTTLVREAIASVERIKARTR